MIKGIVNFSDCSMLVYRYARDFCIFLHCATLPDSVFSTSSFLLASLEFSMHNIMSSTNRDSFISSFPIWNHFYFLLLWLGQMARTTLSKSDKSGHHGLVPDLIGNTFSSSLLRMMFAEDFSDEVFIMLRCGPFMPISWRIFIQEKFLSRKC